MRPDPRFGPHGEPVSSPAYRAAVDLAARDALAAIESHRRGEVDDLGLCRAIVDDEYLREIVPIELLRGLIGREALGEPDDDEVEDVDEPQSFTAGDGEDEIVEEIESIDADRDALAAHLERRRDA